MKIMFFITISLAVRRVVLDVNRSEAVEALDVSFSPPDRHLRSLVYLVVLPSAEYRRMVATFLCSSFCVNGFRMIFLPWIVSVLSSSSLNCRPIVLSFSTLQMLLWFGPPYLDWVEARPHIDTCSIPLVRVSGKKDIE